MKISSLQLFLVLSLSSLILHPSQVTANNNNIGVPLGIVIDNEFHNEVEPIIKSTINYLNNQIKYGRNKWFFYLNVLPDLENHVLIRTVCTQMSRGILAMFSHISTVSYETLRSLTSFYEMPFITMTHPVHEYNYRTNEDKNDDRSFSLDMSGSDYSYVDRNSQLSSSYVNRFNKKSRDNGPSFLLNMHPDLVPLLVSMIKYNRWKNIIYVYDNEEALNRLEGLFEFQIKDTDFHTNILVRKLDDIDNARQVLKPISVMKEKEDRIPTDPYRRNDMKNEITIFLDLKNVNSYKKFLDQAKFMGMNTAKYHYFLITLSIQDLDLTNVRQGGSVITGFSMIDSKNLNTLTLLADALQMNVPLSQLPKISYRAALFIDSLIFFNKQIHQLIGKDMNRLFGFNNVSLRDSEIYINNKRGIDCSPNFASEKWPLGRLIIENLKNMPSYEGLTGPISFDSNGFRSNYTIYIYRMAMNIPLTRIGTYSNQNGLKIIEEAIFRERDGLASINRNRKRIVVSIPDEPFFMVKPDDPTKNLTGNDRYMGYCVDLAEHIAKVVNITYEFRVVKDNKFGTQQPNGEWNGIIGELVRHEADLAIAGLTISLVRERAVEFSKPFMNLGISIMVYKPTQESPKVFSFMAPLSKEIWMCVTLAYVGISVILFLVSRFSPYEWKLETFMGQRRLLNEFSIFNTLWFCLAAFMQQGVVISPKSISGRLTTSVWWFFTLILISSYTANLAAFLTVERMVSPIESAEDLSKQNDIQYGVVDGGSTMYFFRTNKNPIYQKMWSFMSSAGTSVFVKDNFEGVKKVRESKGKYAFLLESSVNEYLNERQPCNTMKVGNNLDSKGYGIATPIGSELKEAINLAVLQAKEDGTLEDLKRKWWISRSECGGNQNSMSSSKDASRNALGIANIAGIFYILIIGLVISVIIAAFEILYKARVEARRSKMIFKEAVKSKVRLSITGYENNNLSAQELEDLNTAAYHTGKYGWTLEPPK